MSLGQTSYLIRQESCLIVLEEMKLVALPAINEADILIGFYDKVNRKAAFL